MVNHICTILDELELKQPNNGIAYEKQSAIDIANKIEYPVVVRPSFVLGGALGNIYDRSLMFLFPNKVGGVVDFIDVGINLSTRWYIFNIADSAITIGIIFYFIHSIFFEKDRSKLI